MFRKQTIYICLLAIYIIVLICCAIVFRKSMDESIISTDLFWSWHSTRPMLWSDLLNIAAFVPVGLLLGLIFPKYKLLVASLAGLFLSETFECFQLILHRGVFDVDDLFNNVAGALIGAIVAIVIIRLRRRLSQ